MRSTSGGSADQQVLPPLAGDEDLPIYRRLFRTISSGIAGGRWKPGDLLPAESELARLYAIAPGTVRRAVDKLVEAGQVERRQGHGTLVRSPRFDHAMMRFFQFRDSSGSKAAPESRIVSRRAMVAPLPIRDRLGLRADAKVVHVVRHRLWDGARRLLEDIYLPFDRFENLLSPPPQDIGDLLYPAYERICGQIVFSIEEEIAIQDGSDEDLRALELASGSLIVTIERLARDATGAPIEWRASRGEARRFRYQVAVKGPL